MSNLIEQIADEVHIKLTGTKDFLCRQEATTSILASGEFHFLSKVHKEMIGNTHNPILLM